MGEVRVDSLGKVEELRARIAERAFAIEAGLHQPVGAYLLNTGRNLALIDCGGHASFIPTTGQTLAALRADGAIPIALPRLIAPAHALLVLLKSDDPHTDTP